MIDRRPAWEDFDGVLVLVGAADLAATGASEWTEDSRRAEWEEFDVPTTGWVIALHGRVAGYATWDDRGGGRLIVEKELRAAA